MKIAIIGHKRIPSREGGIEIVVQELAARMAAQGHQVHAYNRRGRHVAGREHTGGAARLYEGVHLHWIPTIPRKGLDALFYSFFATVAALFGGYDIIHYHALGPSVMLRLARWFGNRTVATVHGLDWRTSKWGGFAERYLRFGEKTLARKADAVTVLSRNMQAYFAETHGRETVFIPNGVSGQPRLPAREITQRYGLRGGDYILFLSRLVPGKGVEYLLDAFAGLDTGQKLVIAGGASHTEGYVRELQQRAAQDDRIIMTGFVQGDLLAELFSNCSLYVMPSDSEGMPMSLLEAMSYGCACLVSDIPENLAVVEDKALVFAKSDSADLREKLQQFLREGFPACTPEEIRRYVLEKYDWDAIVGQYLALYRSILH